MSNDAPSQINALEQTRLPGVRRPGRVEPGKQSLVCPFCGTVSPYTIDQDTGTIEELDLVKALRELPDEQRGWKTERRSVQCSSCKAVMVYDSARVGQNCEFCGSPALVAYQELKSPIRPQSLLPFKITQSDVRDNIKRWYGSKWFAPGALKKRALVDQLKGLYIPYWTFDAQVHCPWQAEAGYHYYVTETYRDNQGQTQTRQVQHTRWEHAQGVVDHFFDDEAVPATHGVEPAAAEGRRAVPDEGTRPVRHRVPLGPRRRTLPGGAARRGQAVAGFDAPAARVDVRRRRCRATRTGTCGSRRPTAARRSSTSSCRCGC